MQTAEPTPAVPPKIRPDHSSDSLAVNDVSPISQLGSGMPLMMQQLVFESTDRCGIPARSDLLE